MKTLTPIQGGVIDDNEEDIVAQLNNNIKRLAGTLLPACRCNKADYIYLSVVL